MFEHNSSGLKLEELSKENLNNQTKNKKNRGNSRILAKTGQWNET